MKTMMVRIMIRKVMIMPKRAIVIVVVVDVIRVLMIVLIMVKVIIMLVIVVVVVSVIVIVKVITAIVMIMIIITSINLNRPGSVLAVPRGPAKWSRLEKVTELVVTVWAICTDNGPDPTGCRHMLHCQTGRNPTSWVFDTNCFLHQYQLIIKAELFTLDFLMKNTFGLDFGYFAMLSKTMHLWRDKSYDIYLCIAWQFGALAAKVASTVPPKCIAARWGCISRFKSQKHKTCFMCSRNESTEILFVLRGVPRIC